MNWVEYVRRDTEGSDSDTRRRAASELVKALTDRFPAEVRRPTARWACCAHHLGLLPCAGPAATPGRGQAPSSSQPQPANPPPPHLLLLLAPTSMASYPTLPP